MPYCKYVLTFCVIVWTTASFSQEDKIISAADLHANPIVAAHYSLTDLQQVSAGKLNAINYYYTQSFILDSIVCTGCRSFDPASFDVAPYEQFRKQSERYVREYTKYGFKLTLLSRDEMTYEPVR